MSKLLKILFFVFPIILQSQDCSIVISGSIVDEGTSEPLSYVNIVIQELNIGTISAEDGSFKLDKVCPGEFHFIFSHIGCDPVEKHVDIEGDTTLVVELHHTPHKIEEIVVQGKNGRYNNQPTTSVRRQTIEDNIDENLAILLESEIGVSAFKTGSGVAKPIVHGLYGNRLTILNNGVAQSGQQWGNDHSPEIDPMVANRITVIKGTGALEYMGGNLGSIILVEPSPIKEEPHLHGQASYVYETNGRGHNTNFQLQKHTDQLAWKINTTAKMYGDRKAPDYFLRNTGVRELNFAVQLEKDFGEKHKLSTYVSTFNTSIGMLRGSHIGNLTDLESALLADVPFFTDSTFTYRMDAPRQLVNHHLGKLNWKSIFSDSEYLDIILAMQLNDRKEFDVRRGGRTDIPSLDLFQLTYSTDIRYGKSITEHIEFRTGVQTIYTENTNDPETGILPLIPDYTNFKAGLYTTLAYAKSDWSLNIGLRYDYESQEVATISASLPREIIRYDNEFGNPAAQFAFNFNISNNQIVGVSTAVAKRNPGINELYSAGLHQGVSGIEEGDIDLISETSHKTTLDYKFQFSNRLSFESVLYYQTFDNYIFLNPQDEFRLTIRGAFPVFRYSQTDAEIYGLDLALKYDITRSVQSNIKYSYIRGNDLSNNIPLVNIPTGVFHYSLIKRTLSHFQLLGIEIENFEFGINGQYSWQQNHLLAEQDFVTPPEAYNLLGLNASFDIISKQVQWRGFVKVSNLLSTSYRDYLNRMRYFSDEVGRSISLGVNLKF